ncbi:helicase HerA domain-containing protein [Paenibacillus amylolyticus]|uniref:DUF87 domain-containing protein n=1 Tax=Paenibacillus amylolyticus TaxID=1451 RepID=A0ABD8B3B5_PAEAM
MLTYAKRIIKEWRNEPEQLLVNPIIEGKDKHTGHHVRVLMIKKYHPSILVGYLDRLDTIVSRNGATLRKTIRYAPTEMKFDFKMKNKLARLDENLKTASEMDPARKAEVVARQTILALRDGQNDDDRKILDIQTFLTISADKKNKLDAAEASLQSWFRNHSGELDNLYREQFEAMRQVAPVQDIYSENSEFFNKKHYGQVTFDYIAARTYPMTRGSFSEEEGMYFGRRTEDGGFYFINLCDPNDPRAQNVAVFGKTGEGKSFFLKALVVSLVDEGVVCFVFDLDGEWEDLCKAVGGIYMDQMTDEGLYFEPLTIMPRIKEIDSDSIKYNKNRYKSAISSGIRTFSLLAERLSREEVYEVGEAIRAVYKLANIDKRNPDTWENYDGPRPTIHEAFRQLELRAIEGNDDAKKVYNRVKVYFIGVYDDMFGKEAHWDFNHDAPLVVFRVGSGQTDSESDEEVDEQTKQAQIKMSMGFDIVNANIHLLKIMGQGFSAVLVDEGQRQLRNKHLRRYVFDWYTAIRKQNGMMILAGNSPAIMLDTSEGIGMFENTNHRVYFYMEQSALRKLSQHVDFPIEIQERIAENEGTNRYIIQHHKRYDELIMHVPPEEAALYKTRGLKKTG